MVKPLRAHGEAARRLPVRVPRLAVSKEEMSGDLPGSEKQANDATRSSFAITVAR